MIEDLKSKNAQLTHKYGQMNLQMDVLKAQAENLQKSLIETRDLIVKNSQEISKLMKEEEQSPLNEENTAPVNSGDVKK